MRADSISEVRVKASARISGNSAIKILVQSVRQRAIVWVEICCLEVVRVRHDQEGGLPM